VIWLLGWQKLDGNSTTINLPMNFVPTSADPFESYFHNRAQLADAIVTSGSFIDAYILATASLDALAEIWFSDFPDVKEQLQTELGVQNVPSAIRLTRFLKTFASNDPDVNKVAVICFAEDWKRHIQQDSQLADQLLKKRLSDNPDDFLRSHELPKAYLDIPINELIQECPSLGRQPELLRVLESYEYGYLLYTLYRCPLVHTGASSRRTHGFARGEEIMYYWPLEADDDRITIGFGPNLVTRWLRCAVSGYVKSCQSQSITPAGQIMPDSSQEKRLDRLWNFQVRSENN
jgi:hypothetical protein